MPKKMTTWDIAYEAGFHAGMREAISIIEDWASCIPGYTGQQALEAVKADWERREDERERRMAQEKAAATE